MFLKEYEKIRLIGKGANASVYKVRHAKYGYVRALKVCKEFIEDENDKAWDTFISECRVLLNIGNGAHPNIVHIYQPRLLDNRAIVEMDCIEGDSLHDYISGRKYISLDEFYRFAEQIVDAVAYCHVDVYKFLMSPEADDLQPDPADGRKYIINAGKEKQLIEKYGIVHNDLHSNNIIRREYDGKYILLDFGLAIQDAHCVKSSSRFDGAIEYSSPEKLERGDVSTRSDVYALGILMYEMLCGTVPYPYIIDDGSSPESARSRVYNQHLHDAPPSIREMRKKAFQKVNPDAVYNTDYPEELAQLILKCLSKNPQDRYLNAKELLEALHGIMAQNECQYEESTELSDLKMQLVSLYNNNTSLEQQALILQQKIDAQQQTINSQQKTIATMQQELNELRSASHSSIQSGSQYSEPIDANNDEEIPIVEIESDDTPMQPEYTPTSSSEIPVTEKLPQSGNSWKGFFSRKKSNSK